MNPTIRSPSSFPSRDPLPLLLFERPFLRASRAWCKEGGKGAAEVANEAEEVLAHRWFLLIDEVSDWISCWSSVTGDRSVGGMASRIGRLDLGMKSDNNGVHWYERCRAR